MHQIACLVLHPNEEPETVPSHAPWFPPFLSHTPPPQTTHAPPLQPATHAAERSTLVPAPARPSPCSLGRSASGNASWPTAARRLELCVCEGRRGVSSTTHHAASTPRSSRVACNWPSLDARPGRRRGRAAASPSRRAGVDQHRNRRRRIPRKNSTISTKSQPATRPATDPLETSAIDPCARSRRGSKA